MAHISKIFSAKVLRLTFSVRIVLRTPPERRFPLQAIVLRCGHSFCELCLDEAVNVDDRCPECRRHTQGVLISNLFVLFYAVSLQLKYSTSNLPEDHSSPILRVLIVQTGSSNSSNQRCLQVVMKEDELYVVSGKTRNVARRDPEKFEWHLSVHPFIYFDMFRALYYYFLCLPLFH
ncbi:unnamed protein product [Haemonchus placei]|uniref:RING-type domain-containing protein n=1 Tax=Haemonchus placei TaxID=6290 RepID=A0A0N4WKJ9_HAEPC|nr:unnamed protein product [Haemonchus placei]